MQIVIVGDGKIGNALAEQLSREGHEITIIDRREAPLQQTGEDLDILCVEGNGATLTTQLEAGVDKADLLIAVTASDELNLLCCFIAKKVGARHTIARVRNPEYHESLSLITDDLGLSLCVNPEMTCASEIARSLRIPSAIKTDTFAGGRVELLTFLLPAGSVLEGRTLMELPSLVRAKLLVCAVERGEQDVYIPSGQFRFAAGDRVSFVAGLRDAHAFFRQMHLNSSPIRQVILVGGGRIAYYLARQLLVSGLSVKIIESDYARCEELSALLPKATIFHADGTNESVLLEAGIEQADAFAALTGIDEENILMSLYVRKTWPRIKVVTKLIRHSFQNIISTMDLGSVYSPRNSACNLINRYVRSMQATTGSKMQTLYRLVGGKAEALEFRVAEHSAVSGVPLQNLRLKKNVLIGCITRGSSVIIPSGSDTIEPGDTVVVVTSVTGLTSLEDILDTRRG